MDVTPAARRFTTADQDWFARLSGDVNPLHVDAAWAARNFPGEQVVHGVHALLWALESCFEGAPDFRPAGLTATFVKPLLVGDELHVDADTDGEALQLKVRGELVAVVNFALQNGSTSGSTSETARELCGEVRLPPDSQLLPEAFPCTAAAVGPLAVRGLAALSTLVGMERPGLHGMLSEVKAAFSGPATNSLAYQVRRQDPIFSRLEMTVQGLGLEGTVAAFAGRPSEAAPSDAAIRALVCPAEFAGQTPLIIGATSGLGAVTARLVAAGGAKPLLSFRPGSDTDELVRATSMLGQCDVVPFDVHDPAAGLAALETAGWCGRQVYYFASPRIFRRRLEPYQRDDLRDFLRVYVDGFYEIVRGIMNARPGVPLSVFYPSSVAIDERVPELFEYRTAKAAGEELCERLQRRYKALSIVSVRLPRIDTRQTRAFIRVSALAPEAVMAPIVRQVQATPRAVAT